MTNREKKTLIHQKLEIMKRCYQERNIENFDLFFDTFFDRSRLPVIIGTDNGEWFYSMDRIRWLISYDWEHWGDLEIDTWNFSIRESENHDIIRVRGVLDFGQDRAWDIDIVMIFCKSNKDYACRLMQFKIPRNEIRPVVVLNGNQEEQDKSEREMRDLMQMNGDVSSDLMREHLGLTIRKLLQNERPYLANLDVRPEMIFMEENGDEYLFAMTGFCLHTEKRALVPFRMIGIGRGYEILDAEFSHPFVSSLG